MTRTALLNTNSSRRAGCVQQFLFTRLFSVIWTSSGFKLAVCLGTFGAALLARCLLLRLQMSLIRKMERLKVDEWRWQWLSKMEQSYKMGLNKVFPFQWGTLLFKKQRQVLTLDTAARFKKEAKLLKVHWKEVAHSPTPLTWNVFNRLCAGLLSSSSASTRSVETWWRVRRRSLAGGSVSALWRRRSPKW